MPDCLYALLGALVLLAGFWVWVMARCTSITKHYRVHFPDGTTDRDEEDIDG